MKKIIFDTDIGYDCDDAGALALLHSLCELGEAELLAVTACYDSPYVAGCIDAINHYYKRSVPIGVLYGIHKAVDGEPVYAQVLCAEFPNDFRAEHAVTLLRRVLSLADDHSITLVITGSLATAGALLASEPDNICPLSGRELIAQKLERTVIMGGRFFEAWPEDIRIDDVSRVTWEWNIKADVPAAKAVCQHWPGKLFFASYEIGLHCISMKRFCDAAFKDHPVYRAYALHGSTCGRSSWDQTAILEAVRPGKYFQYSTFGQISVDDEGITRHSPSADGMHSYLLPKLSDPALADTIDSLVLAEHIDE